MLFISKPEFDKKQQCKDRNLFIFVETCQA